MPIMGFVPHLSKLRKMERNVKNGIYFRKLEGNYQVFKLITIVSNTKLYEAHLYSMLFSGQILGRQGQEDHYKVKVKPGLRVS